MWGGAYLITLGVKSGVTLKDDEDT